MPGPRRPVSRTKQRSSRSCSRTTTGADTRATWQVKGCSRWATIRRARPPSSTATSCEIGACSLRRWPASAPRRWKTSPCRWAATWSSCALKGGRPCAIRSRSPARALGWRTARRRSDGAGLFAARRRAGRRRDLRASRVVRQSGGSDVAIGRRSVMPRRRLWMDGYAIRRHQITIGEYVDFLNDLVRQGRQNEASPVAPRVAGRQGELGALLLDQNPDGTIFISPNNYFGIPWHPDWPSVFVDWYGATAYAREKAARSGKRFRLPTEFEWEKATRGVDARRFPWGDFLDPTWCRMLETHAGFPTPSPAGTVEVDESPYGATWPATNVTGAWTYPASRVPPFRRRSGDRLSRRSRGLERSRGARAGLRSSWPLRHLARRAWPVVRLLGEHFP